MKKASEMDSNVLWDEIAEASQGHVFASQARFELQRRMNGLRAVIEQLVGGLDGTNWADHVVGGNISIVVDADALECAIAKTKGA